MAERRTGQCLDGKAPQSAPVAVAVSIWVFGLHSVFNDEYGVFYVVSKQSPNISDGVHIDAAIYVTMQSAAVRGLCARCYIT